MILSTPLYRFPAGDANRPILANPQGGASGASSSLNATWVNPEQLPFYCTRLAAYTVAGAAQYPTRLTFFLNTPELSTQYYIGGEQLTSTLAALESCWGFDCNIIIPPRYRLQLTAGFNAGAASNIANLYAWGFFFPRGTIGMP